MITRFLLIAALVLGQLSAGAVIAMPASISVASHDEETCCGGNCCCEPQACMCSGPVDESQPPLPAPTQTSPSREQLTLASSPIIAILSHSDADAARNVPMHFVIDPAAVRAPERLARLCIWLT